MNIPLTPLRFLSYARRQYGDRIAVVCDSTRCSYREFGSRVDRLAGGLLELGLRPGDRVAYLGYNCHRLLECYYGVLAAGCVLLPLNFRLSSGELNYILNDAAVTVLFVDSQFLPLVDSFRESLKTVKAICLLDQQPGDAWLHSKNYEEIVARASPHQPDYTQIDEDSVAELFYTSGTSARPKGVMLTHRNVYLHAMNICVSFEVENGSTNLHTIPLFHANGWGVAHYLTQLGGKHIMLRAFDAAAIFRSIQAEKINHFNVVPAMAIALVNHSERDQFDLSSLRRIVVGGAASSPTLIREMEVKLGCRCFSGYGLTETSPSLSLALPRPEMDWDDEERYRRQAMAGYPICGLETRIVDANGQDLPQDGDAFGELIVRGDGVMKGYWGQPEFSAETLRDGWLRTGDMASISPDGCIRIVDRKKDIIISGGENISSLEVENTILAYPAVMEAAVIPVADKQWGEVPKALVVLRPGMQATEAELISFCRDSLAHYKCPRSVVFVSELPKTGTGKVLKKDLRKQYEQQT